MPDPNSTREIPLTQGKFAIVDAADFEWLNKWKWRAKFHYGLWHALRSSPRDHGRQHDLFMHRVILNAPDGVEVDHRDGDGLNNRRSNLRLATRQQNGCNRRLSRNNTSGFTGVHWDKGKWQAKIKVNGHFIYLGRFVSRQEAAQARAAAAKKHHGEFAR